MNFILDCFSKTPNGTQLKEGPTTGDKDAPPPPPPPPPKLTYALLQAQDASTSATIVKLLAENETFVGLAECEAEDIISRDDEDGVKLQAGIQISIDKGVLPELEEPPAYMQIDVIGKSPQDVCDIIIKDMGAAAKEGGVIVLCGLSGTGKGTTVEKLKERLPTAVTWSNGNVFRTLTLLAVTWCELFQHEDFEPEEALTPANLSGFMRMMSFTKADGKWDIAVKGLGLDFKVSEVTNTLLKSPKVGRHIPTVAERTQGEVVAFAARATERMGLDGLIVLLEGRAQTCDYVPTPYRYTLVMSDTTVLGQRRAAQRLGAVTLAAVPKTERPPAGSEGGAEGEGGPAAEVEPSDGVVAKCLLSKLDELAYEAGVEVTLEPSLTVTFNLGAPMGLTVREMEPDGDLLVTGVEADSQGNQAGVRIGYFVREVDSKSVSTLDEVFAILKELREAGAESFTLLLTAAPASLAALPAVVPRSDSDSGIISELEGPKGPSGSSSSAPPAPLVIAGPSGVGKGTLIGKVLQDFPGLFGFSVSHTTRAPRPGEVAGKDYHFAAKADLEARVAAGDFLEHATVHGNIYGTSYKAVHDVALEGKICILDIDIQGCKSVKAAPAGALPAPPKFLFVAPPSMEVLARRLKGRGTETEEKIQVRLAAAKGETEYGLAEGNMDAVVVNDELAASYQELVAALAKWYPAVKRALNGHGAGNGAKNGSGSTNGSGGSGETPGEMLERCGLGAYAGAFVKFGVETVEDLETSAKLLSDEELKLELGMQNPAHVAMFREYFGDEDPDATVEEEEEDDEDEDDL